MEQTGTNKNNPTIPSASFVPVEPRKRKKDGMESAEAQVTTRPKLDLGWEQTEEEVAIKTKIDIKDGDIEKVEVSFTEHQMTITLPGGQQQKWCFHGAIDETRSKVSRTKRKFNMTVVKKERGMWPSLEAAEPAQESTASEQQQQEQEQPQQEEELREESPEATSPNSDLPDSLQELRTKEEEPVLDLNHVKHDFFERDDTLTIHVYVKNVNKDVVKIHFDKQSFTVKFQTGDAKFLQLHDGASEETVFCWTVNTKSVIIPGECRWKTTNTCIELKLKKSSADRWATLEAPLKKETSTAPKSTTSWMPAKQSTATPSTSKGSSSSSSGTSSVVFDEMSQVDDNRRGFDNIDASVSQPYSAGVKSQKPMAKVQPLSSQVVCPDQRVGFTGLVNLGNTCYLNSVVQVLANTPELRDYFMGGQFKADIPTQNGGELARCFAVLLKTLWNGNNKCTSANRLKDLVSKRGNSFWGFYQHDAQEFLSYLLDGLHDDVNRAKRTITASRQNSSTQAVKEAQREKDAPSAESDSQEKGVQNEVAQDDSSKPVHVIAEEKWTDHRKREDSFLVDLMYGQYKNKITCPSCKEVSTTFEPFSILPLALPKNKKTLTVTFMWRDAQRKPIKYRVQLVKGSTVEHLTEQLSHKTGVQPKNMRVFEVKNRLFYKRFEINSDLSLVSLKDLIIVSEVLSAVDAGEEVVEIEVIQRKLHPPFPVSCSACKQVCQSDKKLKRCTSCLKVGYCDQKCQRSHWASHRLHCNKGPDPVGCPFILTLPKSHCSYPRIARLMESFARYSVDVFQPPVKGDPTAAATTSTTTTTTTTTPPPPTTTTTTTNPPKISSSGAPSGSGGCGTMLPPPSAGDVHLPSRASGSNLSNSSGSQSSGSLSSLDSISSCSSTATLTADTAHVATFDIGHSGGEGDEEEGMVEDEGKEGSRDERGGGDVDSGLGSVSSLQSGSMSQAPSTSTQGDWKPEADPEKDWTGSCSAERGSSNVQSVAASMSHDRSVPLFFIKPVDVDGRGKRVDRLDDKGDTMLDMKENRHLSMDWRNNDTQPSYVLVQSKDLEVEEDDSVKTPRIISETLTLQQCLDLYHAPEVLSDRNAWTCEKCKSKQEALKQCFLWKIPHIVIFQLKRFTSFDLFTRKIDTKVDFPIRGLDLTPYTYHHDPDDPPALYDLYGVINHIGHTAIGGHYTCRARCADPNSPFQNEVGWRLFDDSSVGSINNEKSVVDQNAYVLFYRRRQAFVPPPPIVHHIAATDAEPQQLKNDDVIREKSEEESSKETERKDGRSFVKLKGHSAGTEAEETSEAALEEEENHEEKQDSEKEDSNGSSEGGGGRLVIDMEDSPPQELGYTDMDAVD